MTELIQEQTFEITVGIPASGKSTWAKVKQKLGKCLHTDSSGDRLPKYFISERDYIRSYMFCLGGDLNTYKFTKAREKAVSVRQEEDIRKAISLGQSVIVSDTNLNKKTRNRIKELSLELGIEPTFKYFDTPLADCIKHNAKRQFTVPEGVLIKMEQNMREYLGKFVQKEEDIYSPSTVIFDIDGTLARMNGRSPFEWSKVYEDLPRHEVVRYLKLLVRSNHHVIILSGRDSVCRLETERWLSDNEIIYSDLYMRPEGDNRPDWVIKEELFDKHIRDRYYVSHVVDDRKMMVQHWQSMGFNTFDVGNGVSDF